MRRTLSARLEALEAAEAERTPMEAGSLTDADLAQLFTQLALGNVTLGADRRARRAWATGCPDYTARLDAALGRLNATLAALPDPPVTTAGLAALVGAVVPEMAVERYCWLHFWWKFHPGATDATEANKS